MVVVGHLRESGSQAGLLELLQRLLQLQGFLRFRVGVLSIDTFKV
jgi:hypothetical protein